MRILLVGGGLVGLVGLGAGCALQEMLANVTVCFCEKESAPGKHQSIHNNGVLHAGLCYAPASAKATMAVRGIRLITAFAQRHAIPHKICGKIVVAVDDSEVPRLRKLHDRGTQNGLRGLGWMNGAQACERERQRSACTGNARRRYPSSGLRVHGWAVVTPRARCAKPGATASLAIGEEIARRVA